MTEPPELVDPLLLAAVGEEVVRRAVGVFVRVGVRDGVADSRGEAETAAVGEGLPLSESAGSAIPASPSAEQPTAHRAASSAATLR
ncbi:hypothetical protein N4G69_42840 [Streptomyces mirabilis]|uniref:hypothetical protein n=1 Tax=Streptomyces mirabilis TaxID=68239 RepID=UPI0021C0FEF7|nr:hypothetical protein [Streptomyces mirabilis]MCT9112247.1 hypothetical protein [Streptomyces mirabilis]